MREPLRGIFPVLQTPFDTNDRVDAQVMRRQVSFCIEAGAHGLVFPVLGSEYQFLTDEERHRAVDIILGEARGEIPVIVGVAAPDKSAASAHARHAAKAKADAVIALPPEEGSPEKIREYYEAISQAAQMPVFIQHSRAGMDAAFLSELLNHIEHVRYVKEEMHPSAHHISEVIERAGDRCLGVFGGAHGRWMLSELHRGASGFMPAAEAVDVHVQIWDAYRSGDEVAARRIFNQLLPLLNLILILGLRTCKEVLRRRGVFVGTGMRMPGAVELDAADERELDLVLADLQPLFTVAS